MSQIEFCASEFRRAIERTPRNSLPITFGKFPTGSCGDVSLLLGHHLKHQGFGKFDYVLGHRETGNCRYTHAWLQQGDILIDITADQFNEIKKQVIVTTDNSWHRSFESNILHEADFTNFDPPTNARLSAAYQAIVQQLRTFVDPSLPPASP